MPILKQCRHQGCSKLIRDGINIYCEYHKRKHGLQQKERYKEYQARRNRDKNQKKLQDFYSSVAWKKLRELIKAEFYYIDIVELYRTGRIVQGEAVHHIIEVEDCFESRLDFDNLIFLTESNHKKIHEKYNSDHKSKKKMQKILLGLVQQFYKDFK